MQKIQLQAQKSPNHSEFVAHNYTSSLFPYFEHWRKEYMFGKDDRSQLSKPGQARSRRRRRLSF
ncbi:hypothetical protein RchiOBHm_Chr4g0398471 [Rosa chinensis]|uniref:Uncharacterized protein n=1 Tax=Rosa chinensis TaxID=74649 RepID=A0A2P6QSB2_ROSCH|nr:hypothetical protein RchiOBHm_Chr4g0398471 [Rosa chinensis]